MEHKKSNDISQRQLIYISRQFSNMFGIPVRLYLNYELIYSFFPVELSVDPVSLCEDGIFCQNDEIGYYIYSNLYYYGIVKHGYYQFVAGPVSEINLTDHELKKLGLVLDIGADDLDSFVSSMKSLSGIHLDTMLQAIILYNFTVNHTMYDISDLRIEKNEQNNIASEIKENEFFLQMNSGHYDNYSRAFSIEQDILRKIMHGDVDGLVDGATKIPSVSSGQLAPQLMRHYKNFFIRLETIAARAAIRAGIEADEILAAEEKYIAKCESLCDIDRIKNLQYHMILDYADRVRKFQQYNGDCSRLVRSVTKYIKNHLSESIRTSEIAEYCGKSRGRITTEFKNQTGMNLSEFIKLKKIQEAQALLKETERNLSDISEFLGFSSQSHFCRVFKEFVGITPAEFRRNLNRK